MPPANEKRPCLDAAHEDSASERVAQRERAVGTAVAALGEGKTVAEYLDYAGQFFAWTLSPQATRFNTTVRIFNQHGKQTAIYQVAGGEKESFMTQITDNDTATISVLPEDDHGFDTADQLVWSASDGGTIISLAVSADTQSCTITPVAPGTGAVVSVSDPSSPDLAAFTAEFDVTTSATSQLVGTVTVNAGGNTPAGP